MDFEALATLYINLFCPCLQGLRADASQAVRSLPHVLDLSNNELEGPVPTFVYQTNLPEIFVPSIFLAVRDGIHVLLLIL